jgi:hypothetical protein
MEQVLSRFRIHRSSRGIAAGVLLLVCGIAAAQPDPEAELEATYTRQIEAAPNDDRAATWMLDLAALRLSRIMRTCDEASVLFGVPTAAQSLAVAAAADSAAALVERAAAAATAAIERLEARLIESGQSPQQAQELAAAIEPVLSKLVDVELSVRIPTLRIECAVLAAALSPPAAAEQKRAEAMRQIGAAKPVGFAAEVRNRLFAAAVLIRMPGPQHGETARRQLQWVLTNMGEQGAAAGRDVSLDAAALVRVHMALIRSGRAGDSAKLECPGRGKDWLVDLLLAEAAAAAGKPPETAAGLLAVLRTHAPDPGELDSTAEPSVLRQQVYEKLGRITGPGMAWSKLDAEIALARAWMLTAAAGAPDAEAAALLTEVAGRADAAAAVRARAMWMLSKGGADARWNLRLVQELPESRLALAAAEKIVQSGDAAGRADMLRALRLLARGNSGDAELTGKYVQLLLAPEVALSAVELNEAVAAVQSLGSAAAEGEPIRGVVSAAAERLVVAPGDAAARDAGLRAAAAWFAWLGGDSRGRADELRLQRVEHALAAKLEPASASLADLRGLIGTTVDEAGSAARARLRVALGIAQRRNGQMPAALATLRSVAEGYEADARSSDSARRGARTAFWSAWAELLEMVVSGELGAGGSGESAAERVQQALRHRERLALIDPELGGEPWAGRIRAATANDGR